MPKILSVTAHEIQDSRGEPTLEVELETEHAKGTASVPAGASVGTHEAHELRDGDMAVQHGRGVSKAIAHVNETIANALRGKEYNQQELDAFLCALDGTPNKSRLGANAILGVSIAFARASAQESSVELYEYLGSLDDRNTFALPQPLFNILNGSKHARHGIDIQECMLAPIGFENMRERVDAAIACVAVLKKLLEQKGYGAEMGDEGGFAPALASNDEGLDLLVEAITQAGFTTDQIKIALDVAASSLYKDGAYTLKAGGTAQSVTKEQMLGWYANTAKKYPLISIEDGFAEDDVEGFVMLEKELGDTLSIVGDDLTVTNVARIQMAAEKKAINACIIKPNQVGTVSESIDAVRAARVARTASNAREEKEWKIFASHRSGETMDTFIADFAVGLSCDYLKAGAPTKPERMAKYNRLLEIEAHLKTI